MSVVEIRKKSENELYAKLQQARHSVGIYSIKEISTMFNMSYQRVKFAVDTKKVKSFSPNRKIRYLYLADWVKYMEAQTD